MFKYTIQYNYRGDDNQGEMVIIASTFACAEKQLLINVTQGAVSKFSHVQITHVESTPIDLKGARSTKKNKKKGPAETK